MEEIKSFLYKISGFDYVSFDVYDTLIYRTVSKPYRQLTLVEWLYKKNYDDNFEVNFVQERIKAENDLREKLQGKEVTLKSIYDSMSCLTFHQRNILMELECYVEINNCVPNRKMLEIANICRNQGKKIVIISDMYLSKEIFLEIFSKIKMPYDYVFISSEVGETKRTGKIFPHVLDVLGIKASQILHIGDDEHNDLMMPRKYGIESLKCLENPQVSISYLNKGKSDCIAYEHFVCFLQRFNQYYSNMNVDFKIGYNVLGPFMFDFCQWLHKEKIKHHIDMLLFVAREGYLIKKCYELLYPNEKITTHYVKLNRNMLRMPMLSMDNKLDSFLKTIPEKESYKFSKLINYLCLHCDEAFLKELSDNNILYNNVIYRKDIVMGKWNALFSYLFDYQKDDIEQQKDYLKEYLSSLKVEGKNVALINNSMNGSVQSMLEQFCCVHKIQTNFIGLQFVKNRTCVKRLSNRCYSWITDSDIISEKRSYIFQSNCLVLEHLMFEPIGTALYLIKKKENVEVYCEPQRSESKDNKFVKSVQDAALKFLEDYSLHLPIKDKSYGLDLCLNLLKRPHPEDAKVLCSLNDDDVEGDKVLSNLSIPFHISEIFKYRHHKDIRWKEGYYAAIRVNKFCMSVVNAMSAFFFYRYHKHSIINDLRFLFS